MKSTDSLRSRSPRPKRIPVTGHLREGTYNRLKAISDERERSMSWLLEKAVEHLLERLDGGQLKLDIE
jgi:predicted DNA-binding protein